MQEKNHNSSKIYMHNYTYYLRKPLSLDADLIHQFYLSSQGISYQYFLHKADF